MSAYLTEMTVKQ